MHETIDVTFFFLYENAFRDFFFSYFFPLRFHWEKNCCIRMNILKTRKKIEMEWNEMKESALWMPFNFFFFFLYIYHIFINRYLALMHSFLLIWLLSSHIHIHTHMVGSFLFCFSYGLLLLLHIIIDSALLNLTAEFVMVN